MPIQGVDTGYGIASGVIAPTMMQASVVSPGVIGLGPSLTSTSNALAAPVTLTNATQYYDGPTVTVGPGTWLLMSDVEVAASAAAHTFTGKLWDGTNAAIASATVVSSAIGNFEVGIPAVVATVAASTTFKVSVKSSGTGDSIQAAAGEGNTLSILTAVRIA